MPNAIHTVHAGGQWVNREEGSDAALSTHATKEEAVQEGREQARRAQTEHMIHNQDGTIGDRSLGSRPSGATPGRFHPDAGTPPAVVRRFSILALLLGVLFLAACGDDFPGDSDGSPGPIGTFTEKAAETGTGQDDNK